MIYQDQDLSSSITMLRHGESENQVQHILAGDREYALTQQGIRQAKSLGRRERSNLANYTYAHCSTVGRAVNTAQLIFLDSADRIRYSDRIREINVGDDYQIDFDAFTSAGGFLPYIENSDKKFPNGETFADFRWRVAQFLAEVRMLRGRHFVVTHAGVINAILHLIDSTDWKCYPHYDINNCETITRSL